MAAEAEIDEATGSKSSKGATSTAGKVKLPLLTLLVVVILGVVLAMTAVAGGLYFFVKSGKLSLGARGRSGAIEHGRQAGPPTLWCLSPSW